LTCAAVLIITEVDTVTHEASKSIGTAHVIAEVRTSAINTRLAAITDHTLAGVYTCPVTRIADQALLTLMTMA
jgi:hypothetical protein